MVKKKDIKFVDKYRPTKLDSVLGQKFIPRLKELAVDPAIPHMLFSGPPGTGKTCVAENIARARYRDMWRNSYKEINASDDRGIAVVRELKTITTKQALLGDRIIFLSEADSMTKDAQEALRRIMETSRTAIFLIDCNSVSHIHKAIRSRSSHFVFEKLDNETLRKIMFNVLANEGFKSDIVIQNKETLEKIVDRAFGDARALLNELQIIVNTKTKTIHSELIPTTEKRKTGYEILQLALAGKFKEAKKAVDSLYVDSKFSYRNVITELKEGIDKLEDDDLAARLYIRLDTTLVSCVTAEEPNISLTSFIAYAWKAPHLGRENLLTGEPK